VRYVKGEGLRGGYPMREYVTTPLLRLAEAAEFLGVRRRVVYQLIEAGQIRAVRSGRTVLIELKSLEDFRASGKML
jgi:excisionase family DNA binding protein